MEIQMHDVDPYTEIDSFPLVLGSREVRRRGIPRLPSSRREKTILTSPRRYSLFLKLIQGFHSSFSLIERL